ncbi:MAG TPA: ABC transporter permease [Opitutus sp.]|nr:ABC transporter permease [Opitutus sp.]
MRLPLRQLAKTPGFTLTVILVLALGIGATTAIFSVIHAVLLNPFPYKNGNALLFVGESRLDQPNSQMPVTYLDYLEWRKNAHTVDQLAFATGSAATLTGIREPAVIRNAAISANAWPLLGLAPELGRVFLESEDRLGAPPVCVLSHATWQKYFNGDPAILGRAIILDDQPSTVIGVMPPRFKFWAGDVWTPVALTADSDQMRSRVLRMDSWVVTRPKAGVTDEQVRAELSGIARQLAQQFPDTNKNVGVMLRHLRDSVAGPLRDPLFILLSAVAAVLLIACANVANLFLARTSARQREFAVRAALGASRAQIVRQTLAESLPLALLGGAAGLLIASWGLDGLLALLPQDTVPAEAQISVNGPVLLFSLAVTLGTLLLFALFPALESSRVAIVPNLQEGARGTASRRTSRVRSALIVAEVGLSLLLLVGAGLLIRSLARIHAIDVGFDTKQLLVAPIQLTEAHYKGSEQSTMFFENAVDRLRALPEVAAVAATSAVPFGNVNGMPLLVEGQTYTDLNQLQGLVFSMVTRDYFRTQGLQLTRGRVFDDTDRAGTQPVIILNQAAVKKFLPTGDPLGQRVMLGAPANLVTPGLLPPGLDKFQWATVIGVVSDVRYFGQQNDPPPAAYIPVRQAWDYPPLRRSMVLLIRTHHDALAVVPSLRAVVQSLDPDLPLGRVASMDMLMADTLQGTRFNVILLGLFAGVALALAVVGIYGVVAWNVAQRTREIGIRQALGANRRDVLRFVIAQGMRSVLLGLAVGLGLSLGVARILQRLLFETSAFDATTYLAVSALLAAVALVACLIPARRATRVDPITALRAE